MNRLSLMFLLVLTVVYSQNSTVSYRDYRVIQKYNGIKKDTLTRGELLQLKESDIGLYVINRKTIDTISVSHIAFVARWSITDIMEDSVDMSS